MKAKKRNGKLFIKVKKGALHKDLGIPQDKSIPAKKLVIKSTDTPLEIKRKTFAKNAAKWHHWDMPYKITKKDGKYVIKKKSTGKTVATTSSYANLKGTLWHREHGK